MPDLFPVGIDAAPTAPTMPLTPIVPPNAGGNPIIPVGTVPIVPESPNAGGNPLINFVHFPFDSGPPLVLTPPAELVGPPNLTPFEIQFPPTATIVSVTPIFANPNGFAGAGLGDTGSVGLFPR